MIISALFAQSLITADLIQSNEVYNEEVNVNGSLVVGVSSTTMLDLIKSDNFTFPLKQNKETDFCVQIKSIDGAYTLENLYKASAAIDTSVRLPIQLNKYPNNRKSYTEGLGITLKATGCLESNNSFIVRSTESEKVKILINGFDATDVYISINGNKSYIDCSNIEDAETIAFNYSCDFKPKNFGKYIVAINRELYGTELPKHEIEVEILEQSYPPKANEKNSL